MSKFMSNRDQMIKELMVSIRKNTQGSKCIEVFEILLNEIEDKDFVDKVIVDTHRFVGEFSRLCKDIDNMKNLDFKAKMLTDEFIQPEKMFFDSRNVAKMYLLIGDILEAEYNPILCDVEKKIVVSGKNKLGNIYRRSNYTSQDVVDVTKFFGKISDLGIDEVKSKYELARKVVLLYNYMPAIVKAFIQTKRRSLDLDKNSSKFGK